MCWSIVPDCQDGTVGEEVRVSIRVAEFGPGENRLAQVGGSGHAADVLGQPDWAIHVRIARQTGQPGREQ